MKFHSMGYDKILDVVECGTGEIRYLRTGPISFLIEPVLNDPLQASLTKDGVHYQRKAASHSELKFEQAAVADFLIVAEEELKYPRSVYFSWKQFQRAMVNVLACIASCPEKSFLERWTYETISETAENLTLNLQPVQPDAGAQFREIRLRFELNPLKLIAVQLKDTTGNRTFVYVLTDLQVEEAKQP